MNNYMYKIDNSLLQGHSIFSQKGWIKYNKYMGKYISMDAALLFSFLFDIENYMLSNKLDKLIQFKYYFLATYKFVSEELGMSEYKQRNLIKQLQKLNLIEVKHVVDNKRAIKIKWSNVILFLNKCYSEEIIKNQNKIEGESINKQYENLSDTIFLDFE